MKERKRESDCAYVPVFCLHLSLATYKRQQPQQSAAVAVVAVAKWQHMKVLVCSAAAVAAAVSAAGHTQTTTFDPDWHYSRLVVQPLERM